MDDWFSGVSTFRLRIFGADNFQLNADTSRVDWTKEHDAGVRMSDG